MRINQALKHFGSLGILACALVVSLLLSGCSSGHDSQFETIYPPGAAGTNMAASPETSNTTPGDVLDVIQKNDALTITFTDLPEHVLPVEDRVKQDGTITLLQNQTFEVAGKTRGDVEKEIRERYVPKYFKTMTVSVKKTEQTQFYYVGGEVKLPNRQVYLSRVTVLRAIQSAGGFTDFAAKNRVELIRANGRRYTIDCKKALKNPKLDLEVYPGDTIDVPRRIF